MTDTVLLWIGIVTALWCAAVAIYATTRSIGTLRDGDPGLMTVFSQLLGAARERARKAGGPERG